jgi:two-component system sensor histidine kinase NreB
LLLRVRVLERDLADERLLGLCAALRTEISECAEGVRRLARGLRPPELEDAGLVAALQAHVRGLVESTGHTLELDADGVDGLLAEESKIVLYRIVQEAVSNAVRHSGSDVVRIRVFRHDAYVVAEIRDEGRGFRLGEASDRGGLGLMGMRERASMVGGHVHIESETGGGTTVRVELPQVGEVS